ncbi:MULTISPECIES: SDR family oxidoreductase [unclassified Curtobacterium]|uniref:SDR family oxidoreductase n=1 Tax=unclassified Curtobacterium TaxID=257496 RepID=UPI000DAA44C6|nr:MULTISPECIES: SDR family oxidoreductase [unclassified Curtobacterium]PZE78263.1 short chain dehydrogenase [Curtobacterium sp. MCBD17_019]WIB67892.1 SDR family oxidoreductase [Curtobacterium sp. MCBD17_035]
MTDTVPPVRPTALVTGATRGIGRAIAADLGRTHHVLVGGRSAAAVAAVVDALPSAEPFVADLVAGPLPPLPDRLDVLVHSAGIEEGGRVADTPRDVWERVLATNVVAVAELTRLALPALRSVRGLVVTINSGSGFVSGPGGGVYGASKFALRAFADALREEEREHGVRVSGVHPGRVDTDMQVALATKLGEDYDTRYYLAPEDVAAAVRTVVDLPERGTVELLSVRPTRKR